MLLMISESPEITNKQTRHETKWHRKKKAMMMQWRATLTWVSNGQSADVEVFTASGSQVDVAARVVMDTSLGEHSIVLGFGFSVQTNKANNR